MLDCILQMVSNMFHPRDVPWYLFLSFRLTLSQETDRLSAVMHENVRGMIQGTLQGMWQKRGVFGVKLFRIRQKQQVKQILQNPLLDSKSMWPLCKVVAQAFKGIALSLLSSDTSSIATSPMTKRLFCSGKHHMQGLMSQKNELYLYCTCLFLFSCNVHLLAFINKVSHLKPLSAKITIYWNLFHLILPKAMRFHGKSGCNQCSAFILHRSCSDFDFVVFPSQWLRPHNGDRKDMKRWDRISDLKNFSTLAVWFAGVPCKSTRIPAWSPGIIEVTEGSDNLFWHFQHFSVKGSQFQIRCFGDLLHAQRHLNLCF